MPKFELESGKVFDSEHSKRQWGEDRFHDGNNWISKATGQQWLHERLHLTKGGAWVVEHWSQWQGSHPFVREVTALDAARWLLLNDHDPIEAGISQEIVDKLQA